MTASNTPAAAAAPSAQPQKNAGLRTFTQYINSDATQKYLEKVLAEKKSSFVNNIVALVNNSENLQNCEPMTVMNAAIKATALNLPLDQNLGFAYIIPYKDNNSNKVNAQFQIGYKGLIQLAIRSGQISKINMTDVREGELLGEDILTGDITLRKVADRNGKKIIGYCAYMRLVNGFEKTMYSTREDIEAFALRFSKQQYKGKLTNTWAKDFDAMAKKTVLKALLKFAPLSTEMERALELDQEVQQMSVLNTAAAREPDVIEAEAIAMDEDEPTTAAETTTAQPDAQQQQPTSNAAPRREPGF